MHTITYDQTPIDSSVTSRAFWQQALERSVKTAIQAVPVFFGGGIALADIDWKQAGTAVIVTVIISLLMSVASSRLYVVQNFAADLAQRAARTFIAGFVGSLATLDSLNPADWKQAASLAASMTVLSLITSLGSKNVGTPGSASFLPGADVIPVVQTAVTQVVQQAAPVAQQVYNQVNAVSGGALTQAERDLQDRARAFQDVVGASTR